jgi:hypothetical protein
MARLNSTYGEVTMATCHVSGQRLGAVLPPLTRYLLELAVRPCISVFLNTINTPHGLNP